MRKLADLQFTLYRNEIVYYKKGASRVICGAFFLYSLFGADGAVFCLNERTYKEVLKDAVSD